MYLPCLIGNIVSIILGAVLIKMHMVGAAIHPALLIIEGVVAVAAQLLYFMHRGFRIPAYPMAFATFILGVLLIRYALGGFDLFAPYTNIVIGAIVVLQIAKLPVG